MEQAGDVMGIAGGIALFVAAVVLLWLAYPSGGETAQLFRNRPWIVGQLYILGVLVVFVMSVAAMVTSL